MDKWRNQRGEVPVGCIVGLIILFIAALMGIKLAPVMINVGEFEKKVRELADRANRMEYTDKVIKREILNKADELNLPVEADRVDLKRSRKRIVITVEFTKPVEFPGYTYYMHKVIKEDRPLW